MRPDERTAVRKPRRWLFVAWIAVAVLGGLSIMLGGPIADRYGGHWIVALIDLFVALFLTITGIGWLVYLAMSKRRTRASHAGTNSTVHGDRDTTRRKPH